jgi:hypothetical protein
VLRNVKIRCAIKCCAGPSAKQKEEALKAQYTVLLPFPARIAIVSVDAGLRDHNRGTACGHAGGERRSKLAISMRSLNAN